MLFWLKYIRRIILMVATVFAIGLYFYVTMVVTFPNLQIIRLTQVYAFSALGFLYLSLIVSPLYAAFPKLPLKPIASKTKQAFGLTAWGFAGLHAYFAFFKTLGGFKGFWYLSGSIQIAILLSSFALTILTIMAVTSPSFMHKALGNYWKKLHRFVYLAGLAIIVHFLMIGSHFFDTYKVLPTIVLSLILILIALELLRLYRYILKKYESFPRAILATIIVIIWGLVSYYTLISPLFGIHSH